MGVGLKNIRNLMPLITGGLVPPRASILEYGAQNVSWSSREQHLELAEFVTRMRALNGVDEDTSESTIINMRSGSLMADVMLQCGFRYSAIDIFPSKNTFLFDLNTDTVPSHMYESFDLVTNFGTTEHILNQHNCYKTIHDFTRVGGLIYHDLPMGGYFFHGYFSYTPMFFFHLAEANNYEILYRHYWKAPGSDYSLPAPSEMTNHGWPEDWFQDWGIEFIFRKGTSDPFRLPVETGTASGTIDKAFLNEKGVEIQLLEGITGSTMTDAPTEHEWERQTVHSMNSAVAALQICNVAHPKIDLAAADPIAEIVGSAEFNSLVHFFATSEAAQRALVGPSSQALLYCIIRNLVPDHVFEIGTYKASTTEAICRALWANGHGIAHTVDPYEYGVGDIFAAWPAKLREHVLFYPMNSMAFYIQAIQTDLRPDLVFVDGHHDYEFALFDIECAARLMKPNGFIFIDNIAQPGPYFAARDFLETHPHWREHGASMNSYRPEFAFDPARRTVEHTDFCILRAPRQVFVGIEPFTPGTSVWHNSMVDGISLPISRPATGKLHVQCILRSFGEPLTETAFERSIELAGAVGEVKFSLAIPFRPELISARCTVEPWLTWVGDAPLELTSNPILY